MISAQKHEDIFLISKDRITLTREHLHIPGLRMMGRHMIYNVLEPLEWHYHENAFEFSLSAKGNFVFHTPEKAYPFSRGDVFTSYPNEIHGTGQVPIASGELYWFQLDISREDDLLFLAPDSAKELINKLKAIPNHVIHTEVSKLLPLMADAFEAALSGKDSHLVAAYLVLFLHLLLSYVQKESSHISLSMLRVLDYIQANITAEISLEQLANLSCLSCSQFKQNFKKELGTSPRHYINQQKIEYAKGLLLEGKSITDVAMILNYSSSNYFSSVFKKFTRRTPSEYVLEQSNH